MTEKTEKIIPPKYLYGFLIKKVNLPDFLETEIGCTLNWTRLDQSAKTKCPMPDHQETAPSFFVNLMENGVWVYHCFGCGKAGTIVNFFMDYYGYDTSDESIMAICDKFGFKDTQEAVVSCLRDVEKKVNLKKKIEFAHVVSSNQCRMLLVKDFKRYSKWVVTAYKQMNNALDNDDIGIIEEIGNRASKSMVSK